MTQPLKAQGEYRKDFYKMFEGAVGREMTLNEHVFLKKMMLDYLKEHGTIQDNSKPLRHIWTCVKCRKEDETVGHNHTHSRRKHKITETTS